MDTRFRSKYKELTVTLRSTQKDIVETNTGKAVDTTPPIKCEFENFMYDAEDDSIPLETEEIIKRLKSQTRHGEDFWHVEEPVTPDKLINMTIRELKEEDDLDEVSEPEILIKAIRKEKEKDDPRKSAIKLFKGKLKEEYGLTYEND